ncbi:MAG: LLM class flavin-dependent oxidoreductase, partial [Deltaproteobacteria bacterium]|nr:LLM class flavin-dependent oxidoreductase [Deltaproteobacteria bacterium]
DRVDMARETTLFLRAAFSGRRFPLAEFPTLCDFFRLDPAAQAFLRLPPTKPPDIFIAAAGPRMLKLAGELGDGLIVSNLSFPTAAVRLGALEPALREVDTARRLQNRAGPFTKVLHLHVSASRDGAHAKRFAKRMAAGALIQGHILKQRLVKLPVPDKTTAAVHSAHSQGMSVDEMVELISDDLLAETGAVIAGTPGECITGLAEMLRAARPYSFDIIDIASPLGPDWDEAIDLICGEIVPALERSHGGSQRSS